jgi:TolA-binding protein
MPDREKLSPDKQQHEDTHTSNSPASTGAPNQPSGSNKRKRGTGASSRGVANLTPEQLERKRANDREAQRAIRERTKQQIDRLNQRIQELESSQPYRDLQVVIRQKEAVQAENDEIKRQLASFVSLFHRFLPGSQGLEGTYAFYGSILQLSCQAGPLGFQLHVAGFIAFVLKSHAKVR